MTAQRVAVATTLVAAVVAAHYLPGIANTIIEQELRNGLHILGFALVTAVIFELLPGNSWKTAVVSFLCVLAIGLFAEVAQRFGGRVVDFSDLYRDMFGATIFLVARLLWQAGHSVYVNRILAVGIGLCAVVPLAYTIYTRTLIATNFPVIMGFDRGQDYKYVLPVGAEVQLIDADGDSPLFSGNVGKFAQSSSRWSGLQIETVVKDWSSYSSLVLTAQILDGGQQSQLDLRLTDGIHPCMRTQHSMGGATVSDIPARIRFSLHGERKIDGRPDLDLTGIEYIYIIGKAQVEGATLLIDNIHLE